MNKSFPCNIFVTNYPRLKRKLIILPVLSVSIQACERAKTQFSVAPVGSLALCEPSEFWPSWVQNSLTFSEGKLPFSELIPVAAGPGTVARVHAPVLTT